MIDNKPPPAPASEGLTCAVCDERSGFRWTDTHGVGACLSCGAPYEIYHYEKGGDGKQRRVARPPECLVKAEWLELTRRYWLEVKRNVAPGCCNFPGSSYEVATEDDFVAHTEWFEAHKDEWPSQDD